MICCEAERACRNPNVQQAREVFVSNPGIMPPLLHPGKPDPHKAGMEGFQLPKSEVGLHGQQGHCAGVPLEIKEFDGFPFPKKLH